MNWILIAISAGMLMTSSHENEEACEGRKAMLAKDKITNAKCVDMKQNSFITYGTTNCVRLDGSRC